LGPAASSAGDSDGPDGNEGDGGPAGCVAVGAVGAVGVSLGAPDGSGFPDFVTVAPDERDGVAGVDDGGDAGPVASGLVAGAPEAGSDAVAGSDVPAPRADEFAPPSHAVPTRASTPTSPRPASRTRRRRWRLPGVAIDVIPVLVVPDARRSARPIGSSMIGPPGRPVEAGGRG